MNTIHAVDQDMKIQFMSQFKQRPADVQKGITDFIVKAMVQGFGLLCLTEAMQTLDIWNSPYYGASDGRAGALAAIATGNGAIIGEFATVEDIYVFLTDSSV